MLFEISHGEMVASLGEDAVFVAPPGSLGDVPEDLSAARFLYSTGIPAGVFQPQRCTEAGRFPLVGDKVDLAHHENAPAGCASWPVFGWLQVAHLALDPATGSVHGFCEDGGPVRSLHADLSSLAYLAFSLHRLLREFDWRDGEDEDFARLEEAVEGVRAAVEERDPLPFQGDSLWLPVLDEMASGMWS
ncbi:SUKH-4 family immunity protein [Micromonospora sp. C28SCA-DRY-2]|uniref:SUKH-4 family immunity protein n=1 Tax=Micromonospora sp. C28SCA-DRY-2 TaxID=3059522 RepID=UPI002677328E|nr:SUKH-4 family immunity protein [Micromonospora sp. C28SCA-DRY-2]MDO3705735.1 SUKH-4 family immunity protein [Micromonospora sp. C28SCA-DRY-2]